MAQTAQPTENLPTMLQDKLKSTRAMLEKMKPQLAMVVSDPRYVDTITRMALTTVQRNPNLLMCTPQSVMGGIMAATQLGLELDDVRGLAYLVPYGKVATLVAGYRGLQYLALQTEGVKDIYAVLVHENDDFLYEQGSEPVIRHTPNIDEDPGDVRGGYYMIVFEDGSRRFDFMRRKELDKIRAMALSKAKNPENDELPWNKWPEEMMRKTIIRRACKTLPQNSRLQQAVSLDERADSGIGQHLDILVDPSAVADLGTTTDGAAAGAPPERAPRKSEKTEPGDTQQHGGQSPQAAPPSDAGSHADSGSASTGPVIDPKATVSADRASDIIAHMTRTDARVGSRVALTEMAKTFNHKNPSKLTNEQADKLIAALDAIPAEAPQS